MATKIKQAYGVGQALIPVFPPPVQALRAPVNNEDVNFPQGQEWFDNTLIPPTPYIYDGFGIWFALGAGGGSLNTLTGRVGPPVAPVLGNIQIGANGAVPQGVLFSSGGVGQLSATALVDGTTIAIDSVTGSLKAVGLLNFSLNTVGAASAQTPDILIPDNQATSVVATFAVANITNTACASDLANGTACVSLGVVSITLGDFIDVSILEEPLLNGIDFNLVAGGAASTIRIGVTGVAGQTLRWHVSAQLISTP